jgi:hypothetical protein
LASKPLINRTAVLWKNLGAKGRIRSVFAIWALEMVQHKEGMIDDK